jgi:hypothetical protein
MEKIKIVRIIDSTLVGSGRINEDKYKYYNILVFL